MLHGLASAQAEKILAARRAGPFLSWEDFARRSGLSRAVLSRLAKASAFGSLELNRRAALWQALAQDPKDLPLFARQPPVRTGAGITGGLSPFSSDENGTVPCGSATVIGVPPQPLLPQMSPAEEVLADYRAVGLSLRAHPLKFLRAALQRRGVTPAEQLKTWPNNKPLSVAGIVLVRQRPGTAKGITFVTLEDETAIANLIVRPQIWKRYRTAALGATVLLAHGRLERQGEIIHVLCTRLEDLSDWLRDIVPQSRDFC